MLGQSLSKLLAPPLQYLHDKFLDDYMETGSEDYVMTTQVVLALDRGGNLMSVVMDLIATEKDLVVLFQVSNTSNLLRSVFLLTFPRPPHHLASKLSI